MDDNLTAFCDGLKHSIELLDIELEMSIDEYPNNKEIYECFASRLRGLILDDLEQNTGSRDYISNR